MGFLRRTNKTTGKEQRTLPPRSPSTTDPAMFQQNRLPAAPSQTDVVGWFVDSKLDNSPAKHPGPTRGQNRTLMDDVFEALDNPTVPERSTPLLPSSTSCQVLSSVSRQETMERRSMNDAVPLAATHTNRAYGGETRQSSTACPKVGTSPAEQFAPKEQARAKQRGSAAFKHKARPILDSDASDSEFSVSSDSEATRQQSSLSSCSDEKAAQQKTAGDILTPVSLMDRMKERHRQECRRSWQPPSVDKRSTFHQMSPSMPSLCLSQDGIPRVPTVIPGSSLSMSPPVETAMQRPLSSLVRSMSTQPGDSFVFGPSQRLAQRHFQSFASAVPHASTTAMLSPSASMMQLPLPNYFAAPQSQANPAMQRHDWPPLNAANNASSIPPEKPTPSMQQPYLTIPTSAAGHIHYSDMDVPITHASPLVAPVAVGTGPVHVANAGTVDSSWQTAGPTIAPLCTPSPLPVVSLSGYSAPVTPNGSDKTTPNPTMPQKTTTQSPLLDRRTRSLSVPNLSLQVSNNIEKPLTKEEGKTGHAPPKLSPQPITPTTPTTPGKTEGPTTPTTPPTTYSLGGWPGAVLLILPQTDPKQVPDAPIVLPSLEYISRLQHVFGHLHTGYQAHCLTCTCDTGCAANAHHRCHHAANTAACCSKQTMQCMRSPGDTAVGLPKSPSTMSYTPTHDGDKCANKQQSCRHCHHHHHHHHHRTRPACQHRHASSCPRHSKCAHTASATAAQTSDRAQELERETPCSA